jgi:sodium-dependent dicarboxylate transporter 2/3/5
VAIGVAVLVSELASNTASASMLLPVVMAIAQSAGIAPVPPALGVCLGASLGFALPVSTPPNAIVYGTGYIPIGKMIRGGILFDVLGAVLIWLTLRLLCPLLGLA